MYEWLYKASLYHYLCTSGMGSRRGGGWGINIKLTWRIEVGIWGVMGHTSGNTGNFRRQDTLTVYTPYINSLAPVWGCFQMASTIELEYKQQRPNFRISELLRGPRIDSKESIPPVYSLAGLCTTTLFLLGS